MTLSHFLPPCALGLFLVAAVSVRADRMDDLAKIHLEAIGGKERVDALGALRATGQVFAEGKVVRFTMLAARPAKLRLETESNGRTLVQATDSAEPAWEMDTATKPAKSRAMDDGVARKFVADAEFDDPLVGGAARGYVFDFAGEMTIEGRKFLRVLVTHRLTDSYSLLIDDDTYFIAMRLEQRMTAGGRKTQVVTHYEDFRPVNGVLIAHKITVSVDGNVSQQTKVLRIEPNPILTDGSFRRPNVEVPGLTKP